MTRVVNKNKEAYDIYIGRGSIFGNPYAIGRDGTREQVIQRYEEWFNFMLRDKIFLNELLKLHGKRLGCFCKPFSCHGDLIADFLNNDGYSIVRHEQAQEAMAGYEEAIGEAGGFSEPVEKFNSELVIIPEPKADLDTL